MAKGPRFIRSPNGYRLENLPGATAPKRMMAAMVEVFCDSLEQVPRRILLAIDDSEDRVRLFWWALSTPVSYR